MLGTRQAAEAGLTSAGLLPPSAGGALNSNLSMDGTSSFLPCKETESSKHQCSAHGHFALLWCCPLLCERVGAMCEKPAASLEPVSSLV